MMIPSGHPHLVSVDVAEDGMVAMTIFHLVCPDGGCLAEDEMDARGVAIVDDLDPGLYWWRLWPHDLVGLSGTKHTVEYSSPPSPTRRYGSPTA